MYLGTIKTKIVINDRSNSSNGNVAVIVDNFWDIFCDGCAQSFQSCPALCDPMDCSPPGSSDHGNLQARILGMGCHVLLQGIFLIQGLNPSLLHLLHCRQTLYPLSHLGSPFSLLHILQSTTFPITFQLYKKPIIREFLFYYPNFTYVKTDSELSKYPRSF